MFSSISGYGGTNAPEALTYSILAFNPTHMISMQESPVCVMSEVTHPQKAGGPHVLCHMAKLATTTSSIFTPSLGKAGNTMSSI